MKGFIDFMHLQVGDSFKAPVKFTVTEVVDNDGEEEVQVTLTCGNVFLEEHMLNQDEYLRLIAASDPVAYKQYRQQDLENISGKMLQLQEEADNIEQELNELGEYDA